MVSTMKVLCLILVAALWMFTDRVYSEDAVDDDIDIKKLASSMAHIKKTVFNLAKQTMAQQLFVEERIRSDGHSGIKQTRSYKHGTDSYFESTHISMAAASIHDHSNGRDVLGMGETVVVLNGVEFRTRHNDYSILQASTTDTTFNAVEPIRYPDVPPAVLAKPTVDEQILEMREWIKAFAEQNDTIRDYKPYFRPMLCYMEGAWTLDQHLVEPFVSERHILEANSWEELQQQIRYTSYTGAKNMRENFSYLPSVIISVNDTTGEPLYAQWNYRILCHPYSGDIPRHYLKIQDDMAYRQSTHRTLDQVKAMRAGRFKLSEYSKQQFTSYDLIDKIMAEIPGKDNIPPMLNEDPLEETLFDPSVGGNVKLNTGYYHRMYRANAKHSAHINRAFSDDQLYFAETTQPRIAPVAFKYCWHKRKCIDRATRFTYAIPLELIYLTPLLRWNPYNLTMWDDRGIPKAGGRNGNKVNPEKAFNGTCRSAHHYLTPANLYSSLKTTDKDPADTVEGSVGVLDRKAKNIRIMVASGNRLSLPSFPGMENPLRIRFPIYPLHVEGSTIWKELAVVKSKLYAAEVTLKNDYYHIKLYGTTISGHHEHEFYLSQENYKRAVAQEVIHATTSLDNGHNHELKIIGNTAGALFISECDGALECWDGHDKKLRIIARP